MNAYIAAAAAELTAQPTAERATALREMIAQRRVEIRERARECFGNGITDVAIRGTLNAESVELDKLEASLGAAR